MRAMRNLTLFMLFIIASTIAWADYHLSGEVSDATFIENGTVFLDGDIHITELGSLVLQECTVYYNKKDKNGNDAFPDNVVTIRVEGTFKAIDSTFTSPSCELKESGTIQIHFSEHTSLNSRITGCTFYNLGRQGTAEAQKAASLLITQTTTYYVIENNQFHSTGRTSIRYEDTSQSLAFNSFHPSTSCEGDNNGTYAIESANSDLRISNCQCYC